MAEMSPIATRYRKATKGQCCFSAVPDRNIPSVEAMNRTIESGSGGGYLCSSNTCVDAMAFNNGGDYHSV